MEIDDWLYEKDIDTGRVSCVIYRLEIPIILLLIRTVEEVSGIV